MIGFGEYRPYTATLGVSVAIVNYGGSNYTIWDCAGDIRYTGEGDGYWVNSYGAIVVALGGAASPNEAELRDRFRGINPNGRILTVDGNNLPTRDEVSTFFAQ